MSSASLLPSLSAGLPLLGSTEGHLRRLQELLQLRRRADEAGRHRGRQPTPLQGLQEAIRQEAVAWCHALREEGQTLAQCGQLLHLCPRTLRFWDHERGLRGMVLAPVGRPAVRSPRSVRQTILEYLKLTGPGIGVPSLQEQFGDVPRAELADVLARYRAVCRARYAGSQRVLHWQSPGRVWAVDFTELVHDGRVLPPILGRYPYVLAVRDLASGMMLAWQPLPAMTEAVTVAALQDLFARYGAPLVLKMDNGSAFRAALVQEYLDESGVIPLYSPPACPGYNGAIEAAIGSLKTRTEEHARQHGRAGSWDVTDLAAAQAAANTSHPRRLNGRSPSAVWETRTLVDALERVVFALTVERRRFQVRAERGIPLEVPLEHWRSSAVDRIAIERALVEHDHLLFTRRRVPLRITTRKVTADG